MPVGFQVDIARTPKQVADILNKHAKQTHFCQEIFRVRSEVWVYHTKLNQGLKITSYDHKYYCRRFKTAREFNEWLEGDGRHHQFVKIISMIKSVWVVSFKRGVL